MTDSSSLLGVIVGGLLTLAAGWLGPAMLERRREKVQILRRRAEKFEDLVAALYEFDHWVDRQKSIEAFGREGTVEISPFAKIRAISAVYFPVFDEKLSELERGAAEYRAWMNRAGLKRLAGDLTDFTDGFSEAYFEYKQKRDTLLDALKNFALREFK